MTHTLAFSIDLNTPLKGFYWTGCREKKSCYNVGRIIFIIQMKIVTGQLLIQGAKHRPHSRSFFNHQFLSFSLPVPLTGYEPRILVLRVKCSTIALSSFKAFGALTSYIEWIIKTNITDQDLGDLTPSPYLVKILKNLLVKFSVNQIYQ